MSLARLVLGLFLFLGMPASAQAAWNEAHSRHFIVYSDGNPKQLDEFTVKLEKFDFLLRTVTGTKDDDPGNPVRVFMLPNEGKVKALANNPNIAGFYKTSDRIAYAVLSRESKSGTFDLGAEEVLFHEYAHHFMLHYFPAAYPAWYVEGFAEFYSVVNFPKDGSIEFGRIPMVRAPTLMRMSIYPLKQLFARDADGLSLMKGDQYYGTAWLVTHYFRYNEARRAEFSRYLTDLTKGVANVDVETYFQGGTPALEKELRAYMRGKMFASTLQSQIMPQIKVALTPLDEAQAALMDPELRLLVGVPEKERADIVRDVRTIAALYPASGYAAMVLAEAELLVENKNAALAAADRAIAANPALGRASSIRAEVLLERANTSDKAEDWKAALTAIVRANKADVEDPVPLAQFYRYHAMKGGPMPALGFDALYKAFRLLPQNPDYRFNLATAFANRQEYDQASIILDPIAYGPHASSLRDAAQRMKAEFEKARKDGKDVPIDKAALAASPGKEE